MKKYIICTFVDSFSFPLREALRKQVWWRALEKKNDFDVSVIVFDKKADTLIKDGIKIIFLDKNSLNSYNIKADYIDFITTIVELRSVCALLTKGKKTLTLCDGYPLGDTKVWARKIVVKLLPYLFSNIFVFSKYQKELLKLNEIEIIEPLLPKIEKTNLKKYENPTLLYMGHLSHFKGVKTLLDSFKLLKKEIKSLDLIIANNMVRGDNDLIQEVQALKEEYPRSIILKGIIDPIEELSKAWIYIYPFTKPGGTMSFALSLYESKKCNTPFIACDVGANKEFFGSENLIPPNSVKDMTKTIKKILNEY